MNIMRLINLKFSVCIGKTCLIKLEVLKRHIIGSAANYSTVSRAYSKKYKKFRQEFVCPIIVNVHLL